MEFSEKLQELRKSKDLTQEELAQALYVSRTAVSKWESGRGYPSIDSLKEISRYFSVSIDDLLSGEKLLSLAQQENSANLRNLCGVLFGLVDLFSFVLIVLPLYPKKVGAFICSVNLLMYTDTTMRNRYVYWTLFLGLMAIGALKVLFIQYKGEKAQKIVTTASLALSIIAVLFLALAGETYAVTVSFLLLIIKGALLLKYAR